MERDDVKPLIAAICRAEKCMQRLLDTVNESMSINDITEVYEVSLVGVYTNTKSLEHDYFNMCSSKLKIQIRNGLPYHFM
jgi:hypothetical protein